MLTVIKTSIPLRNGLYLLWQQCLLLQHARPGMISPVAGSACILQLKRTCGLSGPAWRPRFGMLSTNS